MISFVLALMFLQSAGSGFPAVAADSGTIHVVWQDDSDGNPEIFYSRSTEGGSFTKPLNLSRNPGISDLPRVVARKNSISVVWSDTSEGMYQIMLAQSDDGGAGFGAPKVISDGLAATGPPDIASQDGRVFAAWDETENDGESRIVYWDSTGGRRIIAGSSRGLVPSIAVRGQRVLIAWHTDLDYKQRVYAVQSDDSGMSFSDPVLISGTFQQSVTPSIALAPDGLAFIVWSDRTSGRAEIFMSASDKDGRNYSAPTLISSPGRDSIYPVVQSLDGENIGVAWASGESIVYAHVSPSGEMREPLQTQTVSEVAGAPRLAVENRRPIVIWKDSRAGRPQIFISNDNAPGKPLF